MGVVPLPYNFCPIVLFVKDTIHNDLDIVAVGGIAVQVD